MIDVADAFCPWNAGRWRVGPTVERTDDEADLELDTADLASVYLGAFDFNGLASAERVRELKPGALQRATRALSHTPATVLPGGFLSGVRGSSGQGPQEFTGGIMAIGQYFGMAPTEERMQRFADLMPFERMHAALGGRGDRRWSGGIPRSSSPSRVESLPTAGVTVVGVSPTHRRRGVLRALMRTQLDEAHERGEPLAALWASEETIYGRFGYGLAAFCGEITLAHEHAAFAQPLEPQGTLRLIEPEEALESAPGGLRAAAHRLARDVLPQPHLVGAERDLRSRRNAATARDPKRWVVYERDGGIEGYAVYRHKPGFENGTTTAELRVVEALGATPEALRELWAYLLAIDWIATVKASLLPPDHPLFLLLATPRRLRYRMGDGLWVRLLDVGAALSGRRYASDGKVVFDVVDEFCPWNKGRWQLDGGQATRSKETPDLALPVQSLGSVLLGGVSFASSRARRAGRGARGRRDRARRFALPLRPAPLVP